MSPAPGCAIHFALDTEKWLNLVDVWFGLMARGGDRLTTLTQRRGYAA